MAANGGPTPGDPNQSLPGYLETLDPRGELPDLPESFDEITHETPLTVEEWDDPEILRKAAEVAEWREAQRKKPRSIPGMIGFTK